MVLVLLMYNVHCTVHILYCLHKSRLSRTSDLCERVNIIAEEKQKSLVRDNRDLCERITSFE